LIRLDLPTFDRPTRAMADMPFGGKSVSLAALLTNSAVIFTEAGALGLGGSALLCEAS
jgi:hypothetical protein